MGEEVGLSKRKLTSATQRLEDAGAAEMLPSGEVRAVEGVGAEEAVETAAEVEEARRERRRERLEVMRAYAETTACRREVLLRHFGDEFAGPCNFCDNCEKASGGLRWTRERRDEAGSGIGWRLVENSG